MPRVKAGLKPWRRLYAYGGVESRLFVLEGTALPIDVGLRHLATKSVYAQLVFDQFSKGQ